MSKKPTLEIPCEFGGISINKGTVRCPLTIDRSQMTREQADDTFCGHRIPGAILLNRNGADKAQKELLDDTEHRVDAVFDVKQVTLRPDAYKLSLTCSLADVDINELSRFNSGTGRLIVNGIEPLPEAKPRKPRLSSWESTPCDAVFTAATSDKLSASGIVTLGKLHEYLKTYSLTDIKGIGEGNAGAIEARWDEFRADNPGLNVPELVEAVEA